MGLTVAPETFRDDFKTQPPVDRWFCPVPPGFYCSKQWQPPWTGRNLRSTGGWVLKPPLTRRHDASSRRLSKKIRLACLSLFDSLLRILLYLEWISSFIVFFHFLNNIWFFPTHFAQLLIKPGRTLDLHVTDFLGTNWSMTFKKNEWKWSQA